MCAAKEFSSVLPIKSRSESYEFACAKRSGYLLCGMAHEVLWSAMRLRIAFRCLIINIARNL
jgi:hypothetical protein